MIRKSAMIALSAIAVLGIAISAADARPFGGPGGFKPGGFKPGVIKPGMIKPIGLRPIRPIRPIRPKWPGRWPGFRPHKPHGHWHVHRRHYWYAAPVAAYAVARPAAPGPCTCLSKEYTPDGVVVFKDRCTNEMAMNPPPAPPPQAAAQMPEQQPQAQAAYTPSYPPQVPGSSAPTPQAATTQ